MSLKERIEEVAGGLKGTLGVAVKNLGTGEKVLVRGNTLFQLASVFKVPVIVTLYRQADAGKINLDDYVEMTDYARVPGSGVLRELTPGLKLRVRDYRTLMMMISDNTATDTVVNLVGKDNVNDTMLELGLQKTNISTCRDLLFELIGLGEVAPEKRTIQLWEETMKKMMERPPSRPPRAKGKEKNVTTPGEMMTLLEMIYKGEAASKGACEEIIGLMKKCQTGENRIWKYLPREKVEVAHKTGTVRGVVNDAGVVFPKSGAPYIICTFAKDLVGKGPESMTSQAMAKATANGEEAIAKVSKIVYEHFTT